MTVADIRTHLGSKALMMLSRRDWPDGLVQAAGEDNETWLYQEDRPVRRLSQGEAWNLLNPEREIPI